MHSLKPNGVSFAALIRCTGFLLLFLLLNSFLLEAQDSSSSGSENAGTVKESSKNDPPKKKNKAKPQANHPAVGTRSNPSGTEVELTLVAKIQNLRDQKPSPGIAVEKDIDSPKSVIFFEEKNKFYINSLEGNKTVVFDLRTYRKLRTIYHRFGKKQARLFKETKVLNYDFLKPRPEPNVFDGKPVEACFSHNKKYLWVTYYKRSYDGNAIEPSALAIIDTDADSIVRVMPTGILPKMISCSPNNKYVAVTHWGDNTIGIIDVSSGRVDKFAYVKHLVVGHQEKFENFNDSKPVDRDADCGFCLRGTAFTADGNFLLVGLMGGGGVAVFDMRDFSSKGVIKGMRSNVRHLVVTPSNLYLSSNKSGYVQKTPISEFIAFAASKNRKNNEYSNWKECFAGSGARTIVVSKDEKYIFTACNNQTKIAVIRAADMEKIAEIPADSFPVGLGLKSDGSLLISTCQGKDGVLNSGNTIDIYKVSRR
jgi:DNA-binding beta-propeller fold protein YncE